MLEHDNKSIDALVDRLASVYIAAEAFEVPQEHCQWRTQLVNDVTNLIVWLITLPLDVGAAETAGHVAHVLGAQLEHFALKRRQASAMTLQAINVRHLLSTNQQ